MRTLSRLCAVCLWLTILSVAAAAPPAGQPPGGLEPEYTIQVGDLLSVKFFFNKELSEDVMVRPDGRISLQLIPEVMAAGRTPAGLVEVLRGLYSTQLDRPEIAVIVRSFSAQRIYVDGEVMKPGELVMSGPLTVMQAIARAGGVTYNAQPRHVLLIRRDVDGSPRVLELSLKKARKNATPERDPVLIPFDVVYVSKSGIAHVNAWVDQYIRKNIPVDFGFRYDIN